MHDYSIKLLAAVEGPRELGDDDDDFPHYCRANDRILCMTELTAGGDKSAGETNKKTTTKTMKKEIRRDKSDDDDDL